MIDGSSNLAGEPAVAAFDFDGTLTTRDSFLRFLAWRRPVWQLGLDFVLTAPLLALYIARLTSNDTHKMALFARQFSGMSTATFRQQSEEFAQAQVPGLLRPEALRRLRYHVATGHRVAIVTASLPDWIAPWAKTEGVTVVLGSCAETLDGRLTGRLAGANCYGREKMRRLLQAFPDRRAYRLYAYGDSRGDRELLAAADEAYYRRFP